ncbi:hypothetical protein NIASO_10830 [Niabella soli DSM 19437]|uniref:Uncharacterized protein n=1 Tax=Niabella soli DSM 19437 TaxID=929713 RepID=W0F702_9BACT|nr:hypothetical protein NIASO_10830 [Niabella soli DSM 19437]
MFRWSEQIKMQRSYSLIDFQIYLRKRSALICGKHYSNERLNKRNSIFL